MPRYDHVSADLWYDEATKPFLTIGMYRPEHHLTSKDTSWKDVVCVSRSEEPRLLSSSMLLFLQEWKGTQRFSDERRIAICLCSLWLHHSKIGPETMRRSPTVAWYLDENIQIRPSWRLRNHLDLPVVPFMMGLPMWFDFNASNWELDMMDFCSVLYHWVQLLVKSADM